MFIVNKNKDTIINADRATVIYIGEDRRTIKAVVGDTDRMYRLGCYNTERATQIAFDMLANNMPNVDIFYLPDDEKIGNIIQAREPEKPLKFAGNGKKPVRRGKS